MRRDIVPIPVGTSRESRSWWPGRCYPDHWDIARTAREGQPSASARTLGAARGKRETRLQRNPRPRSPKPPGVFLSGCRISASNPSTFQPRKADPPSDIGESLGRPSWGLQDGSLESRSRWQQSRCSCPISVRSVLGFGLRSVQWSQCLARWISAWAMASRASSRRPTGVMTRTRSETSFPPPSRCQLLSPWPYVF